MTKYINACEIRLSGNKKTFNKAISILTIVLAVIFLGSVAYGMTLAICSNGPLDGGVTEIEQTATKAERTTPTTRAKTARTRTTSVAKRKAADMVNLDADTTSANYSAPAYGTNYAGFPMPDYNANYTGFPMPNYNANYAAFPGGNNFGAF